MNQKDPRQIQAELAMPFAPEDLEWRLQKVVEAKELGIAVPYVTNRAIQNRLDDTVGIDGWHNEFKPWKDGKAQLCGISIYFHERKQWLTKWDGADDSDIESVKGGLSDSMKRAAVEWGIGRYLYGMTQVWVSIEQRGKGFVIVDAERQKLDQTHEKWVQKLQNKTAVPPQNANQEQQQKPRPAQNPQRTGPQGQQRPPQPAPQQASPPQGTPGNRPQPQPNTPAEAAGLQEGMYLVRGAVLKPTLNSGSRTSVQLQDCAGECLQAYTHGPDSNLAPGVILYNVKLQSKSQRGVTFYILDTYDIVTFTAQDAA